MLHWLNKSEKEYLRALIIDDMGEYPECNEIGNVILTKLQRQKLFTKLQDCSV